MNNLLRRAESFARIRHMEQFRKGKAQEPYILHLEEVSELVTSWNFTGNAIAAAWLHDTVEDCPPTSFAEIENEFDVDIANIVRELTDDKSLPKAERKGLQIVKCYQKIQRGLSY